MLSALKAQEVRPDPRRNIIKADVLTPLISTYSLHYERFFDNSFGISSNIAYTNRKDTDFDIEGGVFGIDIRGYLNKWRGVPEGYYISFFGRSKYYTVLVTNEKAASELNFDKTKLFTIGFGFTWGHQWLMLDNRISLELFGGAGFFFKQSKFNTIIDAIGEENQEESNSSLKEISDIFFSAYFNDGFNLRTGFTIGYAF